MSALGYDFGLISRFFGLRSETFVRHHAERISPGRTIGLGWRVAPPKLRGWSFDGPKLLLDPWTNPYMRHVWKLWRRVLPPPPDADRMIAMLDRHGVSTVMCEYMDFLLPAVEPLIRNGVKFYSHAHGYDVSAQLRDPEMVRAYQVYNEAAGVIVVAESIKRRLVGIGLRGDLIHVIPCSVEVPESLPLKPERREVRAVAVGRMVPKKAPLKVLEAFRTAHALRPELRLTYIGDGPLFEEARAFVKAHDLAGSVELAGARPSSDVKESLANSDVFVQHSVVDPESGDEEGLPVAILEALAHGLPVVATRHAGIPEAVLDGRNGYLVEEGDASGMGERLAALASDPTERRRMGLAGWDLALEKFTLEREIAGLRRMIGFEP